MSIVTIRSGKIQGYEIDGILAFDAIPYCVPPIGPHRFESADPSIAWNGVLNATDHGYICPQGSSVLTPAIGSYTLPQSEDCLTVSVRTPSVTGKRPVAVWIHGGANCFGGGNLPCYDARHLSRAGDIVIVNMNFRLGAFGFLHHPAINTVNLTIGDQITALRWVKSNIEAFGGDPEQITLFGQSAGANSIIHLLSLPETRGLFHRVILQSPSIGRGNFTTSEAFEIGAAFLKALGVDSPDQSVIREAVKNITCADILVAMKAIREECVPKFGNMLFKPVKDAWDTPHKIIEAATDEAALRRVPIVIGTTHDEMHGFTLERNDKIRTIQNERFDAPAKRFSERAAQKGCDVWKYRFDWKAPDSPYDSCHCIELPFVFGTWDAWSDAGMLLGITETDKDRLTKELQSLWTNFIREGRFEHTVWSIYKKESDLKVFF